jgi:hypothetical protein
MWWWISFLYSGIWGWILESKQGLNKGWVHHKACMLHHLNAVVILFLKGTSHVELFPGMCIWIVLIWRCANRSHIGSWLRKSQRILRACKSCRICTAECYRSCFYFFVSSICLDRPWRKSTPPLIQARNTMLLLRIGGASSKFRCSPTVLQES